MCHFTWCRLVVPTVPCRVRLPRTGHLLLLAGLLAIAASCEAIVGADFDPKGLASVGGSAAGAGGQGAGGQGGGGTGGVIQGGGGAGGAALLPDGSACAFPSECASGHCVDDLCCDTGCEGECQQCDATDHEGECTPVAAFDPCPLTLDGVCDGRAFCATGAHRFSHIAGDASDQEARGCAFGPDGDFWVAGNFDRSGGSNSLDLGGPTPLTITVVNRRVFVARLDATGDVVFQTAIGDDLPPTLTEFNLSNLAAGRDGSVVLVGTFTGEISACSPSLTSSGPGEDVFVIKLDPSGACSWGVTFVAADLCEDDNVNCPWPLQAAVSPTGEVAVAGGFYEWIDLGDGQRPGTAGAAQTFVGHLDANGNLVAGYVNSAETAWAVPAGVGFVGDQIVVAGTFSGNGVSGSISFGGDGMASNNQSDLFVAGLRQADVWEKGIGAFYKDWSEAAAVDVDGNLVMAAAFVGELDFGLGPIFNTNPSPGAQLDLGLGKLSSVDGTALWPPIGFGPMEVVSLSWIEERIATDGAANVVLAGRLREKSVLFGGYAVPSQLDNNFLVKLNADGDVLWANAFGILDPPAGEPWPFRVSRVAGGPRGEVGLCGFTTNSLDFGGGALTPAGGRDAVYAVFAP